ncbi:cytochrome ubiquinol oxidase subunit I [Vulcanisaeta sp. JCM 16161]|uniref:cytochrome ubiquinol oxidase subunit I n=1 Tax=Vulcanisaeta sp. JCM 16161 TaxID=1295372 RepID=UPI001FB42CE9|nr:cytochrome ubiquinol oxidase subunit I [Vulcanisaeta sp. JCM 16161]
MVNPDAIVTTFHTLFAAYAIGVGAVALALSIRFFRTHDDKYIKLLKPLLWVLTVVLLIEHSPRAFHGRCRGGVPTTQVHVTDHTDRRPRGLWV